MRCVKVMVLFKVEMHFLPDMYVPCDTCEGNTIVVIEHNLDVIKTADWVIDLGPEGGKGGGLIMAEGTPEEVAEVKGSYTGEFLKPMLKQAMKEVS